MVWQGPGALGLFGSESSLGQNGDVLLFWGMCDSSSLSVSRWASGLLMQREKRRKIINPISGRMSPPFANTVVVNVLGRSAFACFLCLAFYFFFLRLKVPCSDLSRDRALVFNTSAYVCFTRR